MKVLIGVMSCERDAANGCHDAIRRTWARHMVPGLDYKLFVGRGIQPLAPDEERLDCSDGPDENGGVSHAPGLCEKTQAMRRWAVEREYEFMFKADCDTYLSPKGLLASGFENYDYSGHFPSYPQAGIIPVVPDGRGKYIYASGGVGYWLSRRAMEAMLAAPYDEKRLDNRGYPAEDLWIPNVLFPLGILGYHDPRYFFKGDRLTSDPWNAHMNGISVHLGFRSGFQPSWLDKCYELSKDAL